MPDCLAASVSGASAAALVTAGGRFMTAPEMDLAARPLGVPGPVLYFLGRVGVVGATTAAAAGSLLGIFPRSMIDHVWAETAAVPAACAVAAYAQACAAWGRAHLAGLPCRAALAERAERVVDAAPVEALPLVAGWRSVARPDDPAARAARAVMLLRELRGALHFCALRIEGLGVPLAVLADPGGGVARLRRLGWPEPAVDVLRAQAERVADLGLRWRRAEAATDATLAAYVAVLPEAERAALAADLVAAEAWSRP
jgi:hypothetical protein